LIFHKEMLTLAYYSSYLRSSFFHGRSRFRRLFSRRPRRWCPWSNPSRVAPFLVLN